MSARVPRLPTTRDAAAVLVPATFALALRAGLVLAIVGSTLFDADGYLAQSAPGSRGAPIDTTGHPPGYAWFLVSALRLVGASPAGVHLLQALLSSFAVFLVADAARRRWGRKAALAAGLLLALDGHAALFPSILASENLCLPGIAALLWLLVPPAPRVPAPRLVLAAVVAGALALVRTGFVVFVPAIALLAFLGEPLGRSLRSRRSWGAAVAAALAGLAVALAFPALRTRETGARFRLGSPLDSVMLWMGNNPAATGRYEEMPGRPETGQPGIPDADALERVARERSRAFVLAHPLRQPGLVARRASHLFAPPKRDLVYLYGNGWAGERRPGLVASTLAWVVLSFGALLAGALAGFARRGDEAGFRLAAAAVLLVALPYLASVGDARYLHPAHGALALCGAAVLAGPPSLPSSRRRIAALALGAVLAANFAWDVSASLPAMRAVAAPGGSSLRPAYHFAR